MQILITLPQDRTLLGQLVLNDDDELCVFGPVPVDGKSDNAAAIAAGNPSRNPELPFGDSPAGNFTATLGHEPANPQNERSYGTPDASGGIPVIWLKPLQGNGTSQAWLRQVHEGLSVNMGLAIHSGALNGTTLRPTHGCIRMYPQDITVLLTKLAGLTSWPVSIVQKDSLPT